jgi:hypothetical protein
VPKIAVIEKYPRIPRLLGIDTAAHSVRYMLVSKLQIKEGQTLVTQGMPAGILIEVPRADWGAADAMLLFATNKLELDGGLEGLQQAAQAGKLTWIAYPKAGQLGTDLNRDVLRIFLNEHQLDTVRQIALDDTWSALRLKAL